jgi:hypothetical protein
VVYCGECGAEVDSPYCRECGARNRAVFDLIGAPTPSDSTDIESPGRAAAAASPDSARLMPDDRGSRPAQLRTRWLTASAIVLVFVGLVSVVVSGLRAGSAEPGRAASITSEVEAAGTTEAFDHSADLACEHFVRFMEAVGSGHTGSLEAERLLTDMNGYGQASSAFAVRTGSHRLQAAARVIIFREVEGTGMSSTESERFWEAVEVMDQLCPTWQRPSTSTESSGTSQAPTESILQRRAREATECATRGADYRWTEFGQCIYDPFP